MTEPKKKLVAPDGGWGYVVVFAYALSNIISFPSLQNFGLLFRNVFEELNFSATDVSVIVNVNSATGLLLGLMNGPLLKTLGYRKYALIGSILTFIGYICTTFSTSFVQFIFFYGLINSLGINIMLASFGLAMNTYFMKRRNIASGYSSTMTGLGPIFMPLLISTGIEYYGVRGTSLLLSGLLLHCVAAAMLLQPVKWHYKTIIEEDELIPLTEEETPLEKNGDVGMLDIDKSDPTDIDLDQEILDQDTASHILDGATYPRRVSLIEGLGRRDISQSKISLYERDVVVEADTKWWSSRGSVNEDHRTRRRRTMSRGNDKEDEKDGKDEETRKVDQTPIVIETKKKKSFKSKLVKLFDLDLLKDPIYINIWLGLSIAFTGEINFSLMTPVILGDRNFDIDSTAKVMSTIAVADILFRFCSPFISNFFKLPARQMYMISLLMLAASRFTLTLVSSYYATLLVALGLGVAKGFRTVFMFLVIPNYVPLEKLASASGLQTVLNGIILFGCGPLIGFLRDKFGSYDVVIYMTICMSLLTVVMWSVEMLIVSNKKKLLNKEDVNSKV